MAAFTDKSIKALQPKANAYRVFEKGAIRGFGIKVQPSGARTFFLQFKLPGAEAAPQQFYTLGRYPALTLAEAREKAKAARGLVEQGIDPREREAEQQAAAEKARRERAEIGTIADLIEDFHAHQTRLEVASADEVQRALIKNVLPVIPALTPAREVTPVDVARVLRAIIARGAETQANRVRSYMSAAFEFAIKFENDPKRPESEPRRYQIESNPVAKVPKDPGAERKRERSLSWDEIRTVWNRLGDTFPRPARPPSKRKRGKPGEPMTISPYCQLALKLMLVTGQRSTEVLQMQLSQLDRKTGIWTIPKGATKKRRAHLVPLPSLAWEIIDQLTQWNGPDCEYLFPVRRDKAKREHIQNSTVSNAAADWCDGMKFEKWTPHDLRRTWKTCAGELGVSKEIRDKVQNHLEGRDASSQHYDMYQYLLEKREALELFNAALIACIKGDDKTLTRLRRQDGIPALASPTA